jgi:hypothetical protein
VEFFIIPPGKEWFLLSQKRSVFETFRRELLVLPNKVAVSMSYETIKAESRGGEGNARRVCTGFIRMNKTWISKTRFIGLKKHRPIRGDGDVIDNAKKKIDKIGWRSG